jgi:cobalamin biosynthesis protein CobD/CbiB
MKLAYEIASAVAESIRETLPDSEATAGVWLAGFTWAFALHWLIVIATTLAYLGGRRRPSRRSGCSPARSTRTPSARSPTPSRRSAVRPGSRGMAARP